jgi:hypothetical protein
VLDLSVEDGNNTLGLTSTSGIPLFYRKPLKCTTSLGHGIVVQRIRPVPKGSVRLFAWRVESVGQQVWEAWKFSFFSRLTFHVLLVAMNGTR